MQQPDPSSQIEVLESRIAPAAFIVTSLKDTGAGTLRDAINNVNSSVDVTNSITFSVHGTIKLASDLPAITQPVSITGPAVNKSNGIVIDGNKHEIFAFTSGAITLTDLTIKNGQAGLHGASTTTAKGGGIYINDPDGVTLTDVTITGNRAVIAGGASKTAFGGAIYQSELSGKLTITNSVISGNVAQGLVQAAGMGGAIFSAASVGISNSKITGNIAQGGNNTTDGAAGGYGIGGGIYCGGTVSSVTIQNSVISGNKAQGGNGGAGGKAINGGSAGLGQGGGIVNSQGSTISVTSCTISNNLAKSGSGGKAGRGGLVGTAEPARGGGIVNHGNDTMSFTLSSSVVTGNQAVHGNGRGSGKYSTGGGVYSNETFKSYYDTFAKNSADYGGGLTLYGSHNAATIRYCTISGNSSSITGGAMYLDLGTVTIQDSTIANNNTTFSGGGLDIVAGTVKIHNDTIVGNKASGRISAGGGVLGDGGSVDIFSTIIAGNKAHSSADLYSNGVVSASYDLIQKTPTTAYTDNGHNLLGVNPLLGSLKNNGGPTQTMLPKTTSPVIDAGSNPDSLNFDQRGTGFPRTKGAGTDIGAVEVQ